VQQGLDAPTLQSLAALQEAQLDQKAESGDRGAGRPHQLRGGVGRAASREHVVHDEHAVPRLAAGSLPGFRIGTSPAPSSSAIGAPNKKPRDSIETTRVIRASRYGSAMR